MLTLTVNPNVVDRSLDMVSEALRDWREHGITATELADAKTEITGLYAVSLGSNRGLASVMTTYEVLGLGAEYILEHPARIRAVTLEQVNEAIKRDFHPDRLVTVVSGSIEKKQGHGPK